MDTYYYIMINSIAIMWVVQNYFLILYRFPDMTLRTDYYKKNQTYTDLIGN